VDAKSSEKTDLAPGRKIKRKRGSRTPNQMKNGSKRGTTPRTVPCNSRKKTTAKILRSEGFELGTNHRQVHQDALC
jgi:hypothetical protein